MLVPTEEPYTDKYLSDEDKKYIAGWDVAVETVNTAFANLELETGLETIDKMLNEAKEDIKEQVLEYLSTDRQTHIVSFIDGYTDEELKGRGFEG